MVVVVVVVVVVMVVAVVVVVVVVGGLFVLVIVLVIVLVVVRVCVRVRVVLGGTGLNRQSISNKAASFLSWGGFVGYAVGVLDDFGLLCLYVVNVAFLCSLCFPQYTYIYIYIYVLCSISTTHSSWIGVGLDFPSLPNPSGGTTVHATRATSTGPHPEGRGTFQGGVQRPVQILYKYVVMKICKCIYIYAYMYICIYVCIDTCGQRVDTYILGGSLPFGFAPPHLRCRGLVVCSTWPAPREPTTRCPWQREVLGARSVFLGPPAVGANFYRFFVGGLGFPY